MEAVLTMPKEEMLTVGEAARRLKVSTRTIRRRIAAGLLKHKKMPGRGATGMEYLIPESAIDEYLANFNPGDDDEEAAN